MSDIDLNSIPAAQLGMTDLQFAVLQRLTQGFGEQDENGVDLSLLRENLKLTPSQRLDKLQDAVNVYYAGAYRP